MRIVSYNILDGGEGRADPIAEVLLAQQADIIAVVESDNSDVLHRLAHRLNMDHVVAAGRKHAVALFSRWQIGDTVNLSDHPTGGGEESSYRFLLAEVLVEPTGVSMPVGVVHLHARATNHDDQVRRHQLTAVLSKLAIFRDNNTPHLLMGDFNADSPMQSVIPSQCKPRTAEAWTLNGGNLPRGAIQMALEHGYLDSLHTVNPAVARTSGSFTTQQPGQRVDYIFTHGFPQVAIRKAWIENDRLAQYASDH